MSLVTRVSVAFLVALALALGGFSACLYYLAGLRLRLALDQELEATLDRFPDRPEGQSGRVAWAVSDESGRWVEGAPGAGRPMVLDGRDLGPLAVDVATTIAGPDGLRWRVLARRIGGGRPPRGPHEAGGGGHHPGQPLRGPPAPGTGVGRRPGGRRSPRGGRPVPGLKAGDVDVTPARGRSPRRRSCPAADPDRRRILLDEVWEEPPATTRVAVKSPVPLTPLSWLKL